MSEKACQVADMEKLVNLLAAGGEYSMFIADCGEDMFADAAHYAWDILAACDPKIGRMSDEMDFALGAVIDRYMGLSEDISTKAYPVRRINWWILPDEKRPPVGDILHGGNALETAWWRCEHIARLLKGEFFCDATNDALEAALRHLMNDFRDAAKQLFDAVQAFADVVVPIALEQMKCESEIKALMPQPRTRRSASEGMDEKTHREFVEKVVMEHIPPLRKEEEEKALPKLHEFYRALFTDVPNITPDLIGAHKTVAQWTEREAEGAVRRETGVLLYALGEAYESYEPLFRLDWHPSDKSKAEDLIDGYFRILEVISAILREKKKFSTN